MSKTVEIPEIGAEMLLNYLYPELEDRWIAHHDGTFYRNYNRDVLQVSKEEADVRLSRDSILGLLPQGLLSQEEDLRKGDRAEKHKELELRLKVLSEAFLPFDTFAFRRMLKVERQVSGLLDVKLEYLLKTYFGFDLAAEQNPYVKEAAVLLPYIRERRGDFGLVRILLSSLFHCRVRMQERRYSQLDSTLCWLPVIRYELLMPNLSAEEFRKLCEELKPLSHFLSEWFMPMEVKLELRVKQHRVQPQVNSGLILDYNTELPLS